MTTDVKVLIAEFLRTHKRLVVPQLGAFIVKAPGGEILFSELFKRDDGVLRGLLTAAGASEIEAAGAIDRLIFDLRHAVQHGGVYLVAGLKGLTYGRPVKTTDAYTFVGSKPARRIDAFLIVAIVAALLAVGVIVYGYVNDRRAKQMQAELMEEVSQSAAADEAAAESVAE